jgi:hypothetical protein
MLFVAFFYPDSLCMLIITEALANEEEDDKSVLHTAVLLCQVIIEPVCITGT